MEGKATRHGSEKRSEGLPSVESPLRRLAVASGITSPGKVSQTGRRRCGQHEDSNGRDLAT